MSVFQELAVETNAAKPRLWLLVLVFSLVVVACTVALIFVQFTLYRSSGSEDSRMSGMVHLRETANKLFAAGLPLEAARIYEIYLNDLHGDEKTRANIAYTVGDLYFKANVFEKALTFFYQVEILDKESPLKEKVGAKIINCLEQLGKYSLAEYDLGKRTKRGSDSQSKEPVVAKIGDEVYTLGDLDRSYDEKPSWLHQQIKDKKAFLNHFVAEEVLYRKALKLQYDKDEQLRNKTERLIRGLMIEKVIEKEVIAQVKISESDVETYFKAHRDDYADKKDGKPAEFGLVKDRVRNDLTRKKTEEAYQELLRQILSSAEVKLFPEAVK